MDERASTGTATESAIMGSPGGGRRETAESVSRLTESVASVGGVYGPKELRVWCMYVPASGGNWRVVRPCNVAEVGQCGGVPTTGNGDTGHQSLRGWDILSRTRTLL